MARGSAPSSGATPQAAPIGSAVPNARGRPGARVTRARERLTVLGFATFLLLAIVGTAFAVGYILGKLLL